MEARIPDPARGLKGLAPASEVYGTPERWKQAVARSDVRLQWDPDHDPAGAPVARRAIQLGLRGAVLRAYAREWIVDVEDVTELVRAQAAYRHAPERSRLLTPRERVYPVVDPDVARRLGVGETI